MDTGKDEGKEKIDKVVEPIQDIDLMQRNAQSSSQNTLATFDKLIKSRWIWGDKKKYLRIFRAIIAENAVRDQALFNLFRIVNIQNRLDSRLLNELVRIAKIVDGLKGTPKEIQDLKSKTNELMNSPEVRLIGKILHDNEEALMKLDKTRQEILRDSIV